MSGPILSPYDFAQRFLGVHEILGDRHHPLVQFCHLLAGLGDEQPDETAWCGSFATMVAWTFGLEIPQHPARARSWLTVGQEIRLADAARGWDVVVLKRGLGPQPGPVVLEAPGHVGFYAGRSANSVTLLGGNQSDGVSLTTFRADRVLGVRRLS